MNITWLLTMLASVAPACPAQDAAAPTPARQAQSDSQPDPLAEAKTLMTQENWKAAAGAFLKFARKQPNAPQSTEATFWVGYCLVKAGEFEQAIQTLRPFEDVWAEDKWADDALLQLGHAYQGAGEADEALKCWKRLVDDYPTSVWRNETLVNIVNLLYGAAKFDECFPYCEQVMRDIADPNTTWETRYIGAFCLNALKRFDGAERWIDRWFDPTRAVHEAYRTVLAIQRHLLEGRRDAATQAVESLGRDFTDLDGSEWIDVLLRTSLMLRLNGQRDQARNLLIADLRRLGGQPEYLINSVLDELNAVLGEDRLEAFWLELLTGLTDEDSFPTTFRVLLRERLVADLRKAKKPRDAADMLRRSLEGEEAEFQRYRAAVLLGEVLANDLNDRESAVKLLDELLPTLKRRDFRHEVQTRLQEYRPAGLPR